MKRFLLTTAAIACLSLGSNAAVFSFSYTSTIEDTTIAGLNTGDAINITLLLDNGNSSLINQTWTSADLSSVTFNFGNGTLVTTFNSPFAIGLDYGTGDITTDGTGAISGFFSDWEDTNVTVNFVTSDSSTSFAWFINGWNGIYYSTLGEINMSDVAGDIDAANWTVTAVPEPATYAGLAGLGALALAFARKRRA
ncbi:MAG: PEP-CTERM sorting domain-containing protein [Opitutales bacterium]|jgi:hypothetical protein